MKNACPEPWQKRERKKAAHLPSAGLSFKTSRTHSANKWASGAPGTHSSCRPCAVARDHQAPPQTRPGQQQPSGTPGRGADTFRTCKVLIEEPLRAPTPRTAPQPPHHCARTQDPHRRVGTAPSEEGPRDTPSSKRSLPCGPRCARLGGHTREIPPPPPNRYPLSPPTRPPQRPHTQVRALKAR